MKQIVKRSFSPIGVDIGAAEIRAVQLVGTPESFDVARQAVFPCRNIDSAETTFDAADARFLAEVLKRRGFVGNRIAISAPNRSTSSHVITLPPRDSGAPVETIARAELARVGRVSPDSFEVAAWYMPSRGRSEQGLAVACDRSAIDERLQILDDAGLTTLAIDLQESSLARACAEDLLDCENAINTIVRVGWNASLGVLTLGDQIVYVRRVEYGVSGFVRDFQERSGLATEEAMRLLTLRGDDQAGSVLANAAKIGWQRLAGDIAREIDTAVTYVSHSYRAANIGRIMLVGYGAGRSELKETLDASLGMQVVVPAWPGSGSDSRIATALGLARRFDA